MALKALFHSVFWPIRRFRRMNQMNPGAGGADAAPAHANVNRSKR